MVGAHRKLLGRQRARTLCRGERDHTQRRRGLLDRDTPVRRRAGELRRDRDREVLDALVTVGHPGVRELEGGLGSGRWRVGERVRSVHRGAEARRRAREGGQHAPHCDPGRFRPRASAVGEGVAVVIQGGTEARRRARDGLQAALVQADPDRLRPRTAAVGEGVAAPVHRGAEARLGAGDGLQAALVDLVR